MCESRVDWQAQLHLVYVDHADEQAHISLHCLLIYCKNQKSFVLAKQMDDISIKDTFYKTLENNEKANEHESMQQKL